MFRNETRESGFSFIEVLMVAGITMALSFGIAQFMMSVMQSSETIKFRGDAENYRFMARMALQNVKVCKYNASKNLTAKNIPNSPQELKKFSLKLTALEYPDGAGVVMPISDKPQAKGMSWVREIKAVGFKPFDSGASYKDYTARVEVHVAREASMYGGNVLMRDFPILFRTDAAGNIKDCSAGESMELALPELKQVCDFIGGTLSEDGKSCTPPNIVAGGQNPVGDRDELASCTITGDSNINAQGIKNAVFIAKRSIIGGLPTNFVTMLRVTENSGGAFRTHNITGLLEAAWSGGGGTGCDGRGGGCGSQSSAKSASTPAGVTGTTAGYGTAPSCTGYWQVAPRAAGQ